MSTPKLYSIGSYSDTSKRFTIEGDNNHVGINVTPDSDYPLYVESNSGNSIKCDGSIETSGKFIGDGSQLTNLPISDTATNLSGGSINATTGTFSNGNTSKSATWRPRSRASAPSLSYSPS